MPKEQDTQPLEFSDFWRPEESPTGNPEHLFGRIRIEDPALDNKKWKTLALGTETVARLRRTEVYGQLPKEGPALVFSNHANFMDIFILPWLATKTADRSLRIVARDTLIHPEIEESKSVLRRIGKLPEEDEPSEDCENVLTEGVSEEVRKKKPSLWRRAQANFLQSAGNPILVHRGEMGGDFIRELRETVDSGQMAGMFAQETRTEPDDISNIRPGPAILMKRYFPDIPTYIVSIAHQTQLYRRPSIRISDPVSYRELSPDGRMSIREVQELIKQTMFDQLVQDIPTLKK